jgi:hypothetical protein
MPNLVGAPVSVHVRRATPEDVSALAAIHVGGYEEAYRGLIPDEVIDTRTPALRRRVWSERIAAERPREFVLVADLDGTVRGFVSGRQAEAGEVERPEPHVGCWENLYSDPEILGDARGFRVALALHEALEQAFLAEGFTEAVAFVIDGNDRASRFFTLLGWLPDGMTREVDGHLMHRLRRSLTDGDR